MAARTMVLSEGMLFEGVLMAVRSLSYPRGAEWPAVHASKYRDRRDRGYLQYRTAR